MVQLTLRQARELKGMSQVELARKSGVHRHTIIRLELGTTLPHFDTLLRLEAALGVRHGSLLFGRKR